MKKKPKKKININVVFLIILIVATLVNIKIHLSHPAYSYYKENIKKLSLDLKSYRDNINREIISKLLVITNLVSSQSHETQTIDESIVPGANYISTVAVSNYPNFHFDGFSQVAGKSYAQSGALFYAEGDYINGLRIVSISPQFVQIADRFYSISKTNPLTVKGTKNDN